MVPSSAAIAAPTRPPTTRAVSTGPSSMMVERRITAPRYLSGTTFENWYAAWTAATAPVNRLTTITRPSEPTPIAPIWSMVTR